MSEEEKKESIDSSGSSKKPNLSIIFISCVSTIIILFSIFWFMIRPNIQSEPESKGSVIGYESDIVLDDPQSLQDKINNMIQQVAEGNISLELKNQAVSSNGEIFGCYIANAIENTYDIYLTISLDSTGEELYRSGLIPAGGRIEKFTSSKKLGTGTYLTTLTFHQVEDDHITEHAAAYVEYTLVVSD